MSEPGSAPKPSTTRVLMPLFIDVAGKTVLVVGAGVVATRKVADLVAAGAHVKVVAPRVTEELEHTAASSPEKVTLERRGFEERDVEGAWLVMASTDDASVQARVAASSAQAHVFCIAVDDPPNASAYGGAVVRRGPVTIAISTAGEAPALARMMREVLEQALPDEGFVEAARALRERWKADKTPMSSRFGELVQAFKERSSPKP